MYDAKKKAVNQQQNMQTGLGYGIDRRIWDTGGTMNNMRLLGVGYLIVCIGMIEVSSFTVKPAPQTDYTQQAVDEYTAIEKNGCSLIGKERLHWIDWRIHTLEKRYYSGPKDWTWICREDT